MISDGQKIFLVCLKCYNQEYILNCVQITAEYLLQNMKHIFNNLMKNSMEPI